MMRNTTACAAAIVALVLWGGVGWVCGAGAVKPADRLVWKDGIPPPLSPDNPYIAACNAHVGRALWLLKNGTPEYFFLVWGATAKESQYRENAAVREAALKLFDAETLDLEKKPQAFWGIYGALEAVNLWQLEGKVDPATLKTWLERLRPSVAGNVKAISDTTSWIEWAANTLLQSSAILQLAALTYGRENPADPGIPPWVALAKANLRKAIRIQRPGGAFSYIRNSGPDGVYFAFDAAHLGRYYQLSGDPEAKAALVKMAGWASAATVSGLITPFSSPWWKHACGQGGPYTGPETLATLSNDPTARGLMDKRRAQHIQPFAWSYGNMYGWAPGRGVPAADRCEPDLNANGPALRRGCFDVELPATAWSDSSCGLGVFSTNAPAASSLINAVYLTARKQVERHGVNAYIMLSQADLGNGSGIAGDGWIAGGRTFDAHLGLCGDLPPRTSPWRRTDLWFADESGAAGMLTLVCQAKDDIQGVELWVSTAGEGGSLTNGTLTFKDFELTPSGATFDVPVTAKAHTVFHAFPLTGAGARGYLPGETLAAQVSIVRPGFGPLTAARVAATNGLYVMGIARGGAGLGQVVYNATGTRRVYSIPGRGRLWLAQGLRQKDRKAAAGKKVAIPPHGLMVLLFR
jgi:hypothetical protein